MALEQTSHKELDARGECGLGGGVGSGRWGGGGVRAIQKMEV